MINPEHITIRPATPDDAQVVGAAVVMALGNQLARQYFGDDCFAIARRLAEASDTQYSWRNAMVAELHGKVVAAVVGYDGATLHSLRDATLCRITQYTGIIPSFTEDETSAGEFYIDSLAVVPEFRSMGIGRRLLEAFCYRAFEMGHHTVGLLVSDSHPAARQLYECVGFKAVGRRPFLDEIMTHMQWI